MDNKYNDCIKQANELIKSKQENELIDSPLFPLTFSANTFINDWMPEVASDIFRYRLDNYIHEELKNINIPILIEVGENDECVLVVDKEKVNNYFENNIQNTKYQLNYVPNAPHNYLGNEDGLVKDILNWL